MVIPLVKLVVKVIIQAHNRLSWKKKEITLRRLYDRFSFFGKP
jgi:hypothetical protein